MNSEDVLVFLDALPKYITLFYPGYIVVYLYFFFTGKNMKDGNWMAIKAIFISYLINILCNAILVRMKVDSAVCLNLTLVIFSFVVGYGAAKIKGSMLFEKILNWIKADTVFGEDEFEILRDSDRSAWICVYLKDSDIVYEGSLREVNLNSENKKYICLSGYYKYILTEKRKPKFPYLLDLSNNNDEKVIIYYDNIDLIEKRAIE